MVSYIAKNPIAYVLQEKLHLSFWFRKVLAKESDFREMFDKLILFGQTFVYNNNLKKLY